MRATQAGVFSIPVPTLVKKIMRTLSIIRLVAAAIAMLHAYAAHADCSAVVSASEKAEATGRHAMFDVDGIASPPKGQPFLVTIGNAGYVNTGGTSGSYSSIGSGSATAEATSLRTREQQGKIRCEPLGERRIGNEQAVGFQIRDNGKGTAPDPLAIHMWLSRTSGLPLFHGMGSDSGGLHWVYGSDVVAPPAAKVTK